MKPDTDSSVQSFSASTLPLLTLRRGVVLPVGVTTVPLGRPSSRSLAEAMVSGERVLVAVQLDAAVDEPRLEDLQPVAVLATVKDKVDRGSRGTMLVLEGIERVLLHEVVEQTPFAKATYREVEVVPFAVEEAAAFAASLSAHLRELAPEDRALHQELAQLEEPGDVADRIAAWLDLEDAKKVQVLLTLDVLQRLRLVSELLAAMRERASLQQRIDSEVRRELNQGQKEVILRQQLRAIQKELGDGAGGDLDGLRAKLEEAGLPPEVKEVADRELTRLEALGSHQAESNVLRTYLELLAALPWSKRAEARQDLQAVAQSLDEDHFGLEDVKRRILEHMAVLKLTPQARGTLLCLAGPPGVGKTSLAQSIADATGRPLVRVSLGGVRDEAEVRGHRRTYVGALPGRIIAAMRKAAVRNPVVVLDEIDKMGRGFAGDPEAALLEVLDPEQNVHFTDHYLELPFDLSEVFFIATANDVSQLSSPMRDRLEIIDVPGYTNEEKVRIATDHLVPKQLAAHGLPEGALQFDADSLALIVRDYTREAGVRQLSRELAKVCRAVALQVARGELATDQPKNVEEAELRRILGRPRYLREMAERSAVAGIAAGLAWTPVGGDVLYVETTRMPGKGNVEITGQLGDVMRESARAALAYLRSHAAELDLELDASFLERNDIHIHVPAGAVPKDGPSAGVTMFVALASLLGDRPVRVDTAMTGEATLRGRVLPVGGIKTKVLAAHRAGFTRVILPKQNEGDLEDVPELTREALEFILVDDMAEALRAALVSPPRDEEAATASKGAAKTGRRAPVGKK